MSETTEQWIYCGRRQGASGGLVQEWLPPDGVPVHFKGLVKGGVIGGAYDVKATRSALGGLRAGSPVYAGPERHEDTEKWAARDRAASVADTVRKREAADAKHARDLGSMTLAELSSICIRLPAPQSMALEVQVLARLRQVRAR